MYFFLLSFRFLGLSLFFHFSFSFLFLFVRSTSFYSMYIFKRSSLFLLCLFSFVFHFQVVACLLKRTSASNVGGRVIGALSADDAGAFTGQETSGFQPKPPFSVPTEISRAVRQINDAEIIIQDETAVPFEDFVKVDSSIQSFEVESDQQASAVPLYVKVVARWNPLEGGDQGGLETRATSVIFGS